MTARLRPAALRPATLRLAALAALALALAGCEEQAAAPAAEGRAASGEVLAGSVSDAMVPLEQLTSQAPLAPRQAPAVGDIDAEQPVVTPMPGIEGGPQGAGDPAAAPEAEAPAAEDSAPPAE